MVKVMCVQDMETVQGAFTGGWRTFRSVNVWLRDVIVIVM